MTQQNQSSTSKQNQDKQQHAHAANDQMEKELKQNEIDKQHNQDHQEVLNTQKHHTDEKTETTKMDDLKAKAIAIGEELLQKGEKILNELKNGKPEAKQNGEANDSKQSAQRLNGKAEQQHANGQDQQDRMTYLKDEAIHKLEDTKQKITDLVHEATTKLSELKQMATDTLNKMKKEQQSKSEDTEANNPPQDAKSKSDQNQADQSK